MRHSAPAKERLDGQLCGIADLLRRRIGKKAFATFEYVFPLGLGEIGLTFELVKLSMATNKRPHGLPKGENLMLRNGSLKSAAFGA
jgi:hypothetical protein